MTAWTTDQLKAIEAHEAFYVSPYREDGSTYGTPTETWALVIDGNVYVRAANGKASRWYQAAISQKAGRVRVGGLYYDVTFEDADTENEVLIDTAYEAKYSNATDAFAIPIMQGEGPKAASVRIAPR
ncbi:DUF2255 family protein [Citricoccus sp. K5]|uniref:DUF2255 family protein n=1 Tax=Citricoccus sp. K5 TaxID=2653135 RepID=UPI0012EFDB9F|nr:DUF2255 family protein [Citricoccus sp. K5]VXB78487.1 conserved hypothetical protein [Citricoccus sp. K5]